MCKGIQICKNNFSIFLNCLEHSILELNSQILLGEDCSFLQPCQELLNVVKENGELNEFAMSLGNLYKNYLIPQELNICTLLTHLEIINEIPELGADLIAYSKKLLSYQDENMLLWIKLNTRGFFHIN